MKRKERDISIDLLRVICMGVVILGHANLYYLKIMEPGSLQHLIEIGIDNFCRFVIPVFFFISGALALSNHKNRNARNFYSKKYKDTLRLLVIFSILYIIYGYFGEFLLMLEGKPYDFMIPMRRLVEGEPYYHLWFMFVLIVLYALTPFLIKIKEKIGENYFCIFGLILLVASSIIRFYIGKPFWILNGLLYIGIYVLGYEIFRIKSKIKEIKWPAVVFIFLLLVIGITGEFILRYNFEFIGKNIKITHYLISPLCPINIFDGLLIYILFIRIRITKMSKLINYIIGNAYLIYLIHAGVASVYFKLTEKWFLQRPEKIFLYISLMFIVEVLFSIFLAEIYKLIENKIKKLANGKLQSN